MVHCCILYHTTITSLTKCFLLRAMFPDEELEIYERDNNTVVIFLWNVPKAAIWQAVLDFETSAILMGYGEGKVKKEAEKKAWQVLHKRILMDGKDDSFFVKENREVYSVQVAT